MQVAEASNRMTPYRQYVQCGSVSRSRSCFCIVVGELSRLRFRKSVDWRFRFRQGRGLWRWQKPAAVMLSGPDATLSGAVLSGAVVVVVFVLSLAVFSVPSCRESMGSGSAFKQAGMRTCGSGGSQKVRRFA